jgi:hypothetical protein
MGFQDWSSVYTSLFLGITLPYKFSGLEVNDCWDTKFPSGVIGGKADKS